jgi:hypothetical protein
MQTNPSQALHMLYSIIDLVRIRFTRRDRSSEAAGKIPTTHGGHTPTLQIKLRAIHLPAAPLLLKQSIELCNDGG